MALSCKINYSHIDQTHENLVDWFRGNHSEAEIKLKLGDVTSPDKYDSYGNENDFDESVMADRKLRVEDTVTKHEKVKQRNLKKEYKEKIRPLYDDDTSNS